MSGPGLGHAATGLVLLPSADVPRIPSDVRQHVLRQSGEEGIRRHRGRRAFLFNLYYLIVEN